MWPPRLSLRVLRCPPGGLQSPRGGPAFLSTHPTGPDRIKRLKENVPKVQALYQQAQGRK